MALARPETWPFLPADLAIPVRRPDFSLTAFPARFDPARKGDRWRRKRLGRGRFACDRRISPFLFECLAKVTVKY